MAPLYKYNNETYNKTKHIQINSHHFSKIHIDCKSCSLLPKLC